MLSIEDQAFSLIYLGCSLNYLVVSLYHLLRWVACKHFSLRNEQAALASHPVPRRCVVQSPVHAPTDVLPPAP